MELPIALESALKALLTQHAIFSWKISFERDNLAVILRLREHAQQSERHNGELVDSVSYKRKTPCQINRDKRRADEFRQRRENIKKTTTTELREATENEKTFERELNTETSMENQNKDGDSGGEHTSGDSLSVTDTKRAARPVAQEASGGPESEMETESNSDSDTDTTDSETEHDQSIELEETARNFVKTAKEIQTTPDYMSLKQKDRNNTFEKVVCDWRCREAPTLLCISNDVIASCYFEEETIIFQPREYDNGIYPFWHYWQAIDQDGEYKSLIDKARNEMKKIITRVRKMI